LINVASDMGVLHVSFVIMERRRKMKKMQNAGLILEERQRIKD